MRNETHRGNRKTRNNPNIIQEENCALVRFHVIIEVSVEGYDKERKDGEEIWGGASAMRSVPIGALL